MLAIDLSLRSSLDLFSFYCFFSPDSLWSYLKLSSKCTASKITLMLCLWISETCIFLSASNTEYLTCFINDYALFSLLSYLLANIGSAKSLRKSPSLNSWRSISLFSSSDSIFWGREGRSIPPTTLPEWIDGLIVKSLWFESIFTTGSSSLICFELRLLRPLGTCIERIELRDYIDICDI